MLLRSPKQGNSRYVGDLVSVNLMSLLSNYECVVYDDIRDAWLETSWLTQAREMLFDEHGDPRCVWDFDLLSNGEQRVQELAEEASQCMMEIIDTNHPILLEVAEHYLFDSVEVRRQLANHWVVKVVGERYG